MHSSGPTGGFLGTERTELDIFSITKRYRPRSLGICPGSVWPSAPWRCNPSLQMSDPAAPPSPSPQRPSLAELFRAFVIVSISGFGGALPWARRKIVEQKGWMTTQEFNEAFALSQFLSGPNVVNFSVVLGSV